MHGCIRTIVIVQYMCCTLYTLYKRPTHNSATCLLWLWMRFGFQQLLVSLSMFVPLKHRAWPADIIYVEWKCVERARNVCRRMKEKKMEIASRESADVDWINESIWKLFYAKRFWYWNTDEMKRVRIDHFPRVFVMVRPRYFQIFSYLVLFSHDSGAVKANNTINYRFRKSSVSSP